MELVWKEHCGRLTLQQLSSADACNEHLRNFERTLVEKGLQGTVLGNCDDVQGLIVKSFMPGPAAPNGKALAVLAKAEQSFRIVKAAEELADMAKQNALEGNFRLAVKVSDLKSYRAYMQDPALLEELKGILAGLDFSMAFNNDIKYANGTGAPRYLRGESSWDREIHLVWPLSAEAS